MRKRLADIAALTSLALCLATLWIWFGSYRTVASAQAELPSPIPRFLNFRGQLVLIAYSLPRDLQGRVIHLSVRIAAQANNRILFAKAFVGATTPPIAGHPSTLTVLGRAGFVVTLWSNPSLANGGGFGYSSGHPLSLYTAKNSMPPVRDTLRVLAVPDWLLAMATALYPATWALRARFRYRARRSGLCPRCGYDLRATPARCPECGAYPATASA